MIIGVIAACLPTLRPIFVKLMPGLFGASSSRGQSGRPSRGGPYYGAGSHGYPLANGNDGSRGGGAWSRGKGTALSSSSPRSPATLGDSDSAEELHANVGDMGRRGDDEDPEYGLRDLGHVGPAERANYRVEVSGGPPPGGDDASAPADVRRVLSKSDRGRSGEGWGIKATTMITQQVAFEDREKRRHRTHLDSL